MSPIGPSSRQWSRANDGATAELLHTTRRARAQQHSTEPQQGMAASHSSATQRHGSEPQQGHSSAKNHCDMVALCTVWYNSVK